MTSPKENKVYDVVIVGAGLSGLQAALTLLTAPSPSTKDLSILILEARTRVGGKTWTYTSTSNAEPSSTASTPTASTPPSPDPPSSTTSTTPPALKADLGAAWINSTNQSRMFALAKQFNLTLLPQNTVGNVVCEDFGGDLRVFPYGQVPQYPPLSPNAGGAAGVDAAVGDTDDCVRIRDLVEHISNPPDSSPNVLSDPSSRCELDNMTFEGWLHSQNVGARARATAKVWTHAMLGVDPGEVSALYYLEYCAKGGGLMRMRSDGLGGGQELRVREGTGAFSEGLLTLVKEQAGKGNGGKGKGRVEVKFGCAVVAVQDQDGGDGREGGGTGVKVTVRTQSKGQDTHQEEVVQAKKVIISVPTPVYKTISFVPKLSPEESVVDRTRYGFYTKYFVQFKRPFWRDAGYCGLAQSFLGPVSVFRDTSYDDEGIWVLLGFIGGQFGRAWSRGDEAMKKRQVVEQIQKVFGHGRSRVDVEELVLDTVESPWMTEEFSGWGCPCPVWPPGLMGDGDGVEVLRKPHGNVHFVGTEMGGVWRGYMEAAIREGERGAMEVLETLKGGREAKL